MDRGLSADLEYLGVLLRGTPWWLLLVQWLLIGGVIYAVYRFLRGTRGARLLRGIAVLLVISWLVVNFLPAQHFGAIKVLYQQLVALVAFAIIVVFQPELRRAIMRLGETSLFRGWSRMVSEEIEQLVEAATFLSKRRVGALIAIEREVGLGGLAETGTRINAELSAPLLNTIFWPNSPLHDLGVIISQGKIAWAGVQFPLAEEGTLERELGSRHRAAVGLSQESDAVVLVVSEESGDISIAERGQLFRKLTPDALRDLLAELLGKADPVQKKKAA
ncbi:MAG: diadenylate cyclase CdaA [Phycisphaerae bacterium]|nr:diadenylate cyclase CdaA [Phycisphaerae bacterium]MDW8261105.1 diadenylate cyclase CdaA [Phycisphaerales bacterium]